MAIDDHLLFGPAAATNQRGQDHQEDVTLLVIAA
jgi:hypothetical protein